MGWKHIEEAWNGMEKFLKTFARQYLGVHQVVKSYTLLLEIEWHTAERQALKKHEVDYKSLKYA